MFDPSRITPSSLILLDRIVSEVLSDATANEPSIMIIGAHCRDFLQIAFGRDNSLRATDDVDIALAVNGYSEYTSITSSLPKSGTSDVQYSIAGVPVDLVPFGEIEEPPGSTHIPGRTEAIDVFGFQEVFNTAIDLTTPSGHRIKLPLPQGYVALKLKAWCDRSVNGEYKDAGDLAIACAWYQQDRDYTDLLYTHGFSNFLTRADMDVEIAALYLLSSDIGAVLGLERVAELARVWPADLTLIAEYFARERSTARPNRATARRQIEAMTDFLKT